MTRWLQKTLAVSEGVLSALAFMFLLGCTAVAVRYVAEHIVNNQRDPAFWVEYEEVSPVAESFPVGSRPVFYSRVRWHHEVVVAWKDILWCEPSAGPYAGKRIRLDASGSSRREIKQPGMAGFYEGGMLVEGSSSGYWEWDGPVPAHPSTCWLDPRPTLYPSPLVERHVLVDPTTTFDFR